MPKASLKIFEGAIKGWESIVPLKRPNKPTTPQYLFQINCFSLKAVVTSLEHYSKPAEHSSVELSPQDTSVLALTGSDPGQSASKTFVRQPSLHLCELPRTCACPLSPFPRCPLGGVPANAKAAPCLSPLSTAPAGAGERGSAAGTAGQSRG